MIIFLFSLDIQHKQHFMFLLFIYFLQLTFIHLNLAKYNNALAFIVAYVPKFFCFHSYSQIDRELSKRGILII